MTGPRVGGQKEETARNAKILELHEAGIKKADLARRFSLSPVRIAQILAALDRRKGKGSKNG